MAKPALGTKRTCQSCGVRFYDLHRAPIVCPKCTSVFDPDAAQRTRRGRSAVAAAKPTAVRAPVPELVEAPVGADIGDEEIGPAVESDEEAEEVIEDASELGEDEDDMAEVIENVEGEEER